MQKLKVVAAIFGCVLALAALFVPAFAFDPDYDSEQTFNTDIVLDPVQLPGEFQPLADPAVTTAADPLIDRVFSGTCPGFTLSYIGSVPLDRNTTAYEDLRAFLYNSNVKTAGSASGFAFGFHQTGSGGSDAEGPVFGSSGSIAVVTASGNITLTTLSRLEVSFADDTYLTAAQALDSDYFRVTQNQGIGHALGTQIWTFGDSLLSFVTSNFLVMIPIVIWLLVVALSAIKRIADPEG